MCVEGVWLSRRGFDTCIEWWRHVGCVFTWLRVQSESGELAHCTSCWGKMKWRRRRIMGSSSLPPWLWNVSVMAARWELVLVYFHLSSLVRSSEWFCPLRPPERIFDMLFMSVHESICCKPTWMHSKSFYDFIIQRTRPVVLETGLEETDLNINVF